MTPKYLLALIPIIGASVLLWGQDLNRMSAENQPMTYPAQYGTGTVTVTSLIQRLSEVRIGWTLMFSNDNPLGWVPHAVAKVNHRGMVGVYRIDYSTNYSMLTNSP